MKRLIQVSVVAATLMLSNLSAANVLATVDGKDITVEDATAFVKAASPQASYEQIPDDKKSLVTERLIERMLFAKAAQKEGIENTKEFKETLDKIKEELMVSLWLQEQMKNTVVSDSEAKEFFEKNKDKFIAPEKVEVRHILVDDATTAKEILKKLSVFKGEKLKEEFAKEAAAKSKDPGSKNDGKLPAFTKGQMVPEFETVAFELTEGELSNEPVKTQFGYHIILLEKKIQSTSIPYEQVKEKIVESLKQSQFQTKLQETAKELKAKAKITITAPEKTESTPESK